MPDHGSFDYEAKAKEMDALADRAAKGSEIEAGYRLVAVSYKTLAKASSRPVSSLDPLPAG
jgi:hypothetical protein